MFPCYTWVDKVEKVTVFLRKKEIARRQLPKGSRPNQKQRQSNTQLLQGIPSSRDPSNCIWESEYSKLSYDKMYIVSYKLISLISMYMFTVIKYKNCTAKCHTKLCINCEIVTWVYFSFVHNVLQCKDTCLVVWCKHYSSIHMCILPALPALQSQNFVPLLAVL